MSNLLWRGDELEDELVRRLSAGLAEVGLRIELEAKRELQPGHGVLTGTLRRSIHAADPDYNFAGDAPHFASAAAARAAWKGSKGIKGNTKPQIPEMGGSAPNPKREGRYLSIAIGSGLEYAMAVHQGHHSFGGYHYIHNAIEKVEPQVSAILQRHVNG
ncbi:MAG TPA: hypothetical protein PLC98_05160 [Anaerolineales bacterium]|nr:hypothetical protein [Anaerolineales bacterium]